MTWFEVVLRKLPCGSAGNESACNAGDLGLIPGLGRSPGGGKGYPLQYSGLENSMVLSSDFHLRKLEVGFLEVGYLMSLVWRPYLALFGWARVGSGGSNLIAVDQVLTTFDQLLQGLWLGWEVKVVSQV